MGRIIVELKADVVPKTAENFKQLSEAEQGNGLKGSRFHRIITDFMCQVRPQMMNLFAYACTIASGSFWVFGF